MSMSRTDYEKVARIIRHTKEVYEGDGDTLLMVAESLATYFGATNPLFNTTRFFTACGMTDGVWSED